ncbi:MAG: chromosomal replication initiator DnaA [Alphaproteobacteria bacterium]|nr:chromosomal replication initiator DnaA [Alphaproteobacteria bacterium]
MISQIPLPLSTKPSTARADFIVAEGNRDALAFIETWPRWTIPAAALYGPAASGKSHLASIWSALSGAQLVPAGALSGSAFVLLDRSLPVIVEDVDSSVANPARDAAMFDLLESATGASAVLLTGRREPRLWPAVLPDLASRFAALVSFSMGAADESLLRKLAGKLFADRQVVVSASMVDQMLRSLERSPVAIRDFIARTDAKALAELRAISPALIREVLSESGTSCGAMTESQKPATFQHKTTIDPGHGEHTG